MSKSAITVVKKPTSAVASIKQAAAHVEEGLVRMAQLLSTEQKPGVVAEAYTVVDKQWKKAIEDIRLAARDALLRYAEENGAAASNSDVTEVELDFAGSKYRVQKCSYRSKAPEEVALLALLQKKGIKEREAFDEEVSLVVNQAKVDALVGTGLLTREEVDACRKQMPTQLKVEKL